MAIRPTPKTRMRPLTPATILNGAGPCVISVSPPAQRHHRRTSKALAQSRHTVTRGFKQPARRLFRLPDDASLAARPNEISFELSEPGVI